MWKLLVALLAIALLELWTLVWLTRQLGWLPTLGLVLLGGLLGVSLARREGTRVFRDWQAALVSGRPPTASALEGMLVFVSGALFLLPGVLTDVLGLLLLLRPVRRRAARVLRRWLRLEVSGFAGPRAAGRPASRPEVLDTEGEAVEDFEDEHSGPRQLH
jgi:UPF0716 protein FxsA